MLRFWIVALGVAGLASSCLKSGEVCKLQIAGSDQMQYDQTELKVSLEKCASVELTLTHSGKLPKAAMGHNWVLSEEANMQKIVGAGMTAGPAADYLPTDRSNVIAATSTIGGGETTTVKFDLKGLSKDKSYMYFCTFPGHFALMKGKLILE